MNMGLTGGIATGKSSVSAFLASKGALIIDADVIAREVMLPGHPVLAATVQRFGQAILHEDGTLDRKKLGSIVFGNPEERKALEAITHPAIRQEMRERAAAYRMEYPDKLVVSDIPLLYESGLENGFDEVMVIYVPRSVQKERLMIRDGLTSEQADARLGAQMDIELKKQRADIVIDNSGSWPETEKQLAAFWHRKGLS